MKKYVMVWIGKDEFYEVEANNGMEAYDKAYDHFTNCNDDMQICVAFYIIYNADGSIYDDMREFVDFIRSGQYCR